MISAADDRSVSSVEEQEQHHRRRSKYQKSTKSSTKSSTNSSRHHRDLPRSSGKENMPATTRNGGAKGGKGGKTSRSKSAPARTTKKKRSNESDTDNDHDEEIVELQEDKEKLERALEAQAKEMECLKKKHDEALARASQKSGRAPPSKRLKSGKGNQTIEEKRTHTLCRKGLKKVAWGFRCFINNNSLLVDVTKAVAAHVQPTELQVEDPEEKQRLLDQWVEDHKDVVLFEFNGIRNYTQSQLRELMEGEILKGEDGVTMEELYKCATRDADFLGTPRGEEVMDFCHDKFLFRVGAKELWDMKCRHHNTITNAKTPPCGCHSDGRPCISEDLEAMGILMCENGHKKWMHCALEKKKLGNKFKFDPTADYAKTPFTDSLNGGSKFGGWNQAGRQRFRDIRREIKAARNKDTTHDFEQACLERIR